MIKKKQTIFYTRFFQENIKDLKNMWKGIKKKISSKNFHRAFAAAVIVNGETITNSSDIANVFDNHFTKVAIDFPSSNKFSNKKNILISSRSQI